MVMKKITFSLALLILVKSVISQTPEIRTLSQNELLTKSRNLNTIASVTLIPGIVLIGAGLIMDKGEYIPRLHLPRESTKIRKKHRL